jgi:hypothetical protein
VNAPAETGRPERRVEVIVEGDIAPASGRSLSVGQLQLALRAAQGGASHPVELESETRGSVERGDKTDPQSEPAGRVDSDQTRLRPAGPHAALPRVLGLQSLGHLTARRARRTGSPPAASPTAPGVWDFGRWRRGPRTGTGRWPR